MNPWEKYGAVAQTGDPKPWEKYGAPPTKTADAPHGTSEQPKQRTGGFAEAVVEPALQMATGAIAKPVSDVAGLAALGKEAISPTPGGGDPLGFKREVQNRLTYEPRTKAGQMSAEYNPLALAGKGIGWGSEKAGSAIRGNAGADTLRGAVGNAVQEGLTQLPQFVGAKAGEAVGKGIPKAQAALDEKKGLNAPLDEARDRFQQAGLTTPPEETSWVSGIPGLAKIDKWISPKNQPEFNQLIAQQFNLPKGVALSKEELERVRNEAGNSYAKLVESGYGKEITEKGVPQTITSPILGKSGKPITRTVETPEVTRKLGLQVTPEFKAAIDKQLTNVETKLKADPETFKSLKASARLLRQYQKSEFEPKIAMEQIKQLRKDANTEFKSDDPSKMASAFTRKEIANQLEGLFEDNLKRTGNTKLLNEFRQARKTIAQTYDVEAALDPVGNIDARKLYLISKKKPLSENLKLVADYAGTFPKGAQKSVEGKQAMSPFDWMFALGTSAAGHIGIAAADIVGRAGVPYLAEKGLLQKRTPSYKVGATRKSAPYTLPAVGIGIGTNANQLPPLPQ